MTTTQCCCASSVYIGVLLFAASNAKAEDFTLQNGNSTVIINPEGDYGMSGWNVDCVPQLYRQWFWYRVGGSGGEKTINQLDLVSVQQTGLNTLTTLYRKPGQFTLEISYTLLGGAAGAGYSSIGEQIKIVNLSDAVLDFHLFQYVDFDLGGSNAGDTVLLGQNHSGLYDSAFQNKGDAYFADEIVSPGANHGEVGLYPTLFNSLTDSSPTTLTDDTGPVTGDATWAFQWDASIQAGGSFSVALNKSALVTNIPEPSTVALIPAAFALLAGARCWRRPQ